MTTTSTTTRSSRGIRHRRPRRGAVPFLAPLLVRVGAAGVPALWWSDTTSVAGPAGWLTGAGRITGLLAGYACAVRLAPMARVPLLDHTVGADRLARRHDNCPTVPYSHCAPAHPRHLRVTLKSADGQRHTRPPDTGPPGVGLGIQPT